MGDQLHNVKKRTVVTKSHSYLDVVHVSLTDQQRLRIVYKNDHDFIYISPIAPQIVQEILDRVELVRSVDRKRLAFTVAERYRKKVPELSIPKVSSKHPRARLSRQGSKLMQLTGQTENQRISTATIKFLFDAKSPEGRTRDRFVTKDFPAAMKNPASAAGTVRSFVDGMHDYILSHRAAAFNKLRIDLPLYPSDGLPGDSVSSVVMADVEKVIFEGVQAPLIRCMQARVQQEEAALQSQMRSLVSKRQQFFGVESHLISKSNWAAAVDELQHFNSAASPAATMKVLLESVKAVYATFSIESRMAASGGDILSPTLGADDLLPIFTFVVVQAKLPAYCYVRDILWSLCSRSSLHGESGYYLTVYESALEFVKHVDPVTGKAR